jgi:hypothetical protein
VRGHPRLVPLSHKINPPSPLSFTVSQPWLALHFQQRQHDADFQAKETLAQVLVRSGQTLVFVQEERLAEEQTTGPSTRV